MKCKFCGKEIDEGSSFCGYCGKEQPKVKCCIKCGQEIGIDDTFCGHCGSPQNIKKDSADIVNEEDNTQTKQEMPQKEMIKETTCIIQKHESSSKSKSIKWVFLVVTMVLLVGAGVFGLRFIQQGNSTSINSQEEEYDSPPTIQELERIFDKVTDKGNTDLFSDYGFKLLSKDSKKAINEYDEVSYYTVYKEIYEKQYKICNRNNEIKDGKMTIECIYAPDYGEPSMEIRCDTETWNYMKETAETTLKEFGNTHYFINNYAFIGFENVNIITITCENGVSW